MANKTMYELQRMGCGILLGESLINKDNRDDVINNLEIIMTNDYRMITALKLCGGEVIEKKTIKGIETFMV